MRGVAWASGAWTPVAEPTPPPETWPPPPGNDAPPPCLAVPRAEVFARVACDGAPEAGQEAPSEVFGPWTASLSLAEHGHRRAWIGAVAALAFAVPAGHDRTPAAAWMRDRAPPTGDLWAGVFTTMRTPWSLWRIDALGADGATLTPLLPLSPRWLPSAPVDLAQVGHAVGPVGVGGLLVGKVVASSAGWVASPALALPACPPAHLVEGWLRHVGIPLVQEQPSLKLEDVLRRGGHAFLALAHAWWLTRSPRP